MSALLSVSAGCAAYAAFGCLHAASFERLPATLRPRLAPERWRALMYVMACALLVWALLAWSAHETPYAAVIVVSAILTLAGTCFVLLRARFPRALWASAGLTLLGAVATAVALFVGRGLQ